MIDQNPMSFLGWKRYVFRVVKQTWKAFHQKFNNFLLIIPVEVLNVSFCGFHSKFSKVLFQLNLRFLLILKRRHPLEKALRVWSQWKYWLIHVNSFKVIPDPNSCTLPCKAQQIIDIIIPACWLKSFGFIEYQHYMWKKPQIEMKSCQNSFSPTIVFFHSHFFHDIL